MFVGYLRVLPSNDFDTTQNQRWAILAAGVGEEDFYEDRGVEGHGNMPALTSCLERLSEGDILVVWTLESIAPDLRHLVNLVHSLADRGIWVRALHGEAAKIDEETISGVTRGIFATLAEFERTVISRRTKDGLAAMRARGRTGGRPFTMTPELLIQAMEAMEKPETRVRDLCQELGFSRQTLYRYVSPNGEIREPGRKLLRGNSPKHENMESFSPSEPKVLRSP